MDGYSQVGQPQQQQGIMMQQQQQQQLSVGQIISYEAYEQVRLYLGSAYISSANGSSAQRQSAQEKMSRLPPHSFLDLANNVVDEMNRRILDSPDVPFLPVRPDLDHKKNQARQKLGTLPTPRFKDLACDVIVEVERRSPHFLALFDSKFGDNKAPGSVRNSLQQQGSPAPQQPSPQQQYQSLPSPRASVPMPGSPQMQQQQLQTVPLNVVEQMRKEFEQIIDGLNRSKTTLEMQKQKDDKELLRLLNVEKELNERVQKLEQEKSNAENKYQQLLGDHNRLRSDYESLQSAHGAQSKVIEDLKQDIAKKPQGDGNNRFMTPQSSPPHQPAPSEVSSTSPIVIDPSRVSVYHSAIESLINSTRNGTPTDILVSMKAVVMACKRITEDAENYENAAIDTMSEDVRENLYDIKARLSDALQNLMMTAKAQATGTSNATGSSGIESSSTSLSSIISELVVLLNVRSDAPASVSQAVSPSSTTAAAMDVDSLKNYLERQTDQVVQAIQTLLVAMRNNDYDSAKVPEMVYNVTMVVDQVVQVTLHSLTHPSASSIRPAGEAIVRDLATASNNLNRMGQEAAATPNSAAIRQQLASSSYEIAKYIKELIRVAD